MKFCRRCQWTKEMFDKELLKLEEYIERIPEEERVSDEEYERRLMLCDTCSFMRGGMCGRCGCYVALRAAKRQHGLGSMGEVNSPLRIIFLGRFSSRGTGIAERRA